MSDIVNYVKRNRSPMNKEDINNADALILSWLSYFNFADYLKSSSLKISAIEGELSLSKKEMYQDAFMPKSSYQLFTCLQANPRFSSLTLSDFTNIKDEEKDEQFAAITICINPNLYFISFRGTDPSFLGWEEDFRLAYLSFTPSQIDGVSYVEKELDKHPNAIFLLHQAVLVMPVLFCLLKSKRRSRESIPLMDQGFLLLFLKKRVMLLSKTESGKLFLLHPLSDSCLITSILIK